MVKGAVLFNVCLQYRFLQKQSQYAPTKDAHLSFSNSLVSDAIMVNLALHSTVNFLFGWLVWGGVGGSGGQSGC